LDMNAARIGFSLVGVMTAGSVQQTVTAAGNAFLCLRRAADSFDERFGRRGDLAVISSGGTTVEFGAHLPLIDFGDGTLSLADMCAYARTASELGYTVLSANDHLLWQRPWLDGPTVLTSVLDHSEPMAIATSVALPVVRHPVVVAKWLTTLACLSGRRIIAGLGPGSSRADHGAVGSPFEQRWARFDQALPVVKALVRGEQPPVGEFYDVADVRLDPLPERVPEVWFGSWGSDRRLRAMAAEADGWLASGYNTTPTDFAEARRRLDGHLEAGGRDPSTFPDMIVTMWMYVTSDQEEADRLVHDVLAPVLGREPDALSAQLPIGTPEHCVGLLREYADVGAQQILLWPIKDPIDQLRAFDEHVRSYITAG
jgi:alkanesulfonate monooxygenase SsuD/methylene tetrahydromethanopterin reductase-like flavin-dependent oxidoreductase (luciferase family)